MEASADPSIIFNAGTAILIGIVVGILTSAVLSGLKWVVFDKIVPFWQSIRYEGADLSGNWGAYFLDANSSFTLVISQSAHKVTGTLIYQNVPGPVPNDQEARPEGEEGENHNEAPADIADERYTIEYQINGEYWEGYLNIYCRTKNRKSFANGSLFAKLISNGNGLAGQFSFRHAADDSVVSMPLTFARTK